MKFGALNSSLIVEPAKLKFPTRFPFKHCFRTAPLRCLQQTWAVQRAFRISSGLGCAGPVSSDHALWALNDRAPSQRALHQVPPSGPCNSCVISLICTALPTQIEMCKSGGNLDAAIARMSKSFQAPTIGHWSNHCWQMVQRQVDWAACNLN